MQELFSHRKIRPCNNSENLELFDQEKKTNIFRHSDRKKKKKTVKQGGVRQVVCFELAGEHHDMNIVNRVNRMKYDCHFPSYVSQILLFKSIFPVKRVLI